jgi:hypothetical protein
MATRWQDDPRLSPELRERIQDVNQRLLDRNKELAGDREAELAENKRRNDIARTQYLSELAEKKAAEQARRGAEEEQRLAPEKRREMLAWLIDHPDKTEADFERIWPLVKESKRIGDREAAHARL